MDLYIISRRDMPNNDEIKIIMSKIYSEDSEVWDLPAMVIPTSFPPPELNHTIMTNDEFINFLNNNLIKINKFTEKLNNINNNVEVIE